MSSASDFSNPRVPGTVGAAVFNVAVGAGISIGPQNPSGGVGAASAQGAGIVGGDDRIISTKNGQGGGGGKNASTDCMTSVEHAASIGRGIAADIGTPPHDCPPTYMGLAAGWQ